MTLFPVSPFVVLDLSPSEIFNAILLQKCRPPRPAAVVVEQSVDGTAEPGSENFNAISFQNCRPVAFVHETFEIEAKWITMLPQSDEFLLRGRTQKMEDALNEVSGHWGTETGLQRQNHSLALQISYPNNFF